MCTYRDQAMDRAGELPLEKKMDEGFSRVLKDFGGAEVRGDCARCSGINGNCDCLGSAAVRGEAVALPTNHEIYAEVCKVRGNANLYVSTNAINDTMAALQRLLSARAANAPSEPSQAMERIFESWDGCKYDGIDIGAALRADFKTFVFGKSRAADALDSQPTDDGRLLCAMEFEAVDIGYVGLAEAMAALRRMKADPDSDREALIACLGDDAATLSHINPDDEMAQTMREAIAMLESDEVVIATLGMASSQPTDGGVRNG